MASTDYGKLYAKEGDLSSRAQETSSLSKRLSRYSRAFDARRTQKPEASPSKLKFKDVSNVGVSKRIKHIKSLIPRIQRKYGRYVQRYARQYGDRYGIDPARIEPLVYSMIAAESAGDPQAVSPVGAAGLMQLMPRTWKGAGVTDPHDPKQNVKAGTKIISEYLARYGNDPERALAAYNAGSGNLQSIEAGQMDTPEETQEYVSSILNSYLTEPKPKPKPSAAPPKKKMDLTPHPEEEVEEADEPAS